MHSHPNARLTQRGQLRLVNQHLQHGRSLAEIAHGASTSLLTRAADVVLKERRRLVLLVRETPLTNAHIKNMLAVSEMGGVIAPPVPAFYSKPETLADMVAHTVGRALDIFDLPHDLVKRWEGIA
jgi:polyprenyl P-hydroxybenzoate/phenylacrylic acid decarboxylase-like protein